MSKVGQKVRMGYDVGIVQKIFPVDGVMMASVKWTMPTRTDGRRGSRPPVSFESIVAVDKLSMVR